jgi:hypothetical protein
LAAPHERIKPSTTVYETERLHSRRWVEATREN